MSLETSSKRYDIDTPEETVEGGPSTETALDFERMRSEYRRPIGTIAVIDASANTMGSGNNTDDKFDERN